MKRPQSKYASLHCYFCFIAGLLYAMHHAKSDGRQQLSWGLTVQAFSVAASFQKSGTPFYSRDSHEKFGSRTRLSVRRSGGGRASGQPSDENSSLTNDNKSKDEKDGMTSRWEPAPCAPGEAKVIVVQITDTYTLENLASVKTLVNDIKSRCPPHVQVVSMMTGDFLSPYLLSSVDKGQGMMNALAKIPIDYITWGNHEADINHRTVCRHVREFPGIWLNSNMLDHEAMDHQREFDILTLTSEDQTQTRKLGLVAVLSDDPKLYEHFKAPGAFGGATIDDPWETLQRLQQKLVDGPDAVCDTILPLQHTYVPDDHKTCQMFDVPVVLSGHDHHRVDEEVNGTRLLKPGMDAIYATVLEMSWPDSSTPSNKPVVQAKFCKTSDWEPEPILAEECERAYDALEPLRNTELAKVPPSFLPLSSVDSRAKVCTMGQYICTLLRSSLNVSRRQEEKHMIDAVLLMGGNIRGGTDYETTPSGAGDDDVLGSCSFTMEALEAEIKSDEVIAIVPMPGWLLAEGIQATHAGDPIPGWIQYDDGVLEEYDPDNPTAPPVVTQVRGSPIVMDHVYNVATKISDLTNGQSPPWRDYFLQHPEVLPPKGAYVNIQAELMSYFARNLWRRIWDHLSRELDAECDAEPIEETTDISEASCDQEGALGCNPELRLDTLDNDNDGKISVREMQQALADFAGLTVDERELSLAKFVHEYADQTGNGEVTLEDLEMFCTEMSEADSVHERDQWQKAFSKQTENGTPTLLFQDGSSFVNDDSAYSRQNGLINPVSAAFSTSKATPDKATNMAP